MRAYTLGRAMAHLGARKRGVGLGQLPPLSVALASTARPDHATPTLQPMLDLPTPPRPAPLLACRYLANNQLSGTIPSALGSLTSLRML